MSDLMVPELQFSLCYVDVIGSFGISSDVSDFVTWHVGTFGTVLLRFIFFLMTSVLCTSTFVVSFRVLFC